MKRLLLIAGALSVSMTAGPMASATEAVDQNDTTVDTSKNPITGTVTTTKKMKRKKKVGDQHAEAEVVEKTKQKKDGTVSTTVDVEAESQTN